MNLPTSEQPTELSIDVEQWTRDIQTFAEATSQALNAIVAELSNECSSANSPTATSESMADGLQPEGTETAIQTTGSDRLAKLKSQLAKRISQSS